MRGTLAHSLVLRPRVQNAKALEKIVKNKKFLLAALLLMLPSAMVTTTFAQITPKQDSYTNTATSTTNYGGAGTLGVVSSAASIQTTYIQFDLSSVPAGYNSGNVEKATLKLYVNSVTTGGSINVDYVNGTWSEKTITSGLSPALGNTIASGVALTTASANSYILIDVTSAVGEWLNGSEPNDGLALVANSGLSATFESKENTNQSHPAELDIVFKSGGTITGVTTSAGSGLTGGGTTGTLSLSLPKTCANHQILQWNGSAWNCASAGIGSVSSVALTAPTSDFIVSGSPITGAGTLNFKWNVAPSNADVPNAIVKRDGSGSFAAGLITATTVEAAGIDFGSMFSSTALQNSALVFAQNTATAGASTYGIYGESDSIDPAAAGVYGFIPFGASAASGVAGATQTAYGAGVLGVNSNGSAAPDIGAAAIKGVAAGMWSEGVWGIDVSQSGMLLEGPTGFIGAGVWGDTGQPGNFGVAGTAADGTAGYFENNSPSGYIAVEAVADTSESLSFLATNRQTDQFCYVDSSGDLSCTGSKNAVVPVDGGQRHVALAAIESPKNWFEDFGSARLSAGSALIALEPQFAQTVNTDVEYHVFVTPNGDCKGLYVSQKTAASFEVHELGGGASSISFDYRIVALRKNFENVRLKDHTSNFGRVKALNSNKKAPGTPKKVDISKLMPHSNLAQAHHQPVQKSSR